MIYYMEILTLQRNKENAGGHINARNQSTLEDG
jgi:hypothetical protein